MLSPRQTVLAVPEYHPPLAGRDGLRLDFNENTSGCSPRVERRLRSLCSAELASYPERSKVEQLVAEFMGVSASELLLTNGVDEGIHLLCQTFLDPTDEALIVVPTYSMYRIYMQSAGARIGMVPCGPDFSFPTGAVLGRVTATTRLIAIANPNNPTGGVVAAEDLLRIAEAAPDAAVLIDEAYFEFYGKTMLPWFRQFPNIFIARTFSKAYGLAGLRLGALIGCESQMQAVRRMCSPYNVNAVGLACLPEALNDQNYIERYVSEVQQSRRRLEEALRCQNLPFWRSHANFVLLRVGTNQEAASTFVAKMREHGVLVRNRSDDHGCEGCVRITVGRSEHTDVLLSALENVLQEAGTTQGATR